MRNVTRSALLVVAAGSWPSCSAGNSSPTPARAARRQAYRRRLLANNQVGTYRATLGVVNRRAVAEEIGRIRAPTLVLVGDQDVATVPAKAERIRERIANARLVVVPGASHRSTLEEPETVNAVLVQFLDEQSRQET